MSAYLPCLILAPIGRSNRFAGPFITAGKNQQRQSSTLELTRIVEEFSLGHISKFFFHADVEMYKMYLKRLYKYKNPRDHRVQNVPDISSKPTLPWSVQNRALYREEKKVEFLQGQPFRNEKLWFFHRKGNCVLSVFKNSRQSREFLNTPLRGY